MALATLGGSFMPAIKGIAHVELSVRDLDRSAAWYSHLLAMQCVYEGRDEARKLHSRALFEPNSKLVLGLMQHDGGTGMSFDARSAGLDHLSFAVADRQELRLWENRLAELKLDYTPLEEWDHGAAVTARDPDGIAVEFYVLGSAATVATGRVACVREPTRR
jgi:glyoxylase I family protein